MYLSGSVVAGSVVVTSVLASSSVSQFTLDKERDDWWLVPLLDESSLMAGCWEIKTTRQLVSMFLALLRVLNSQNSRYQRNTSNRDLQPSHCLCHLPTRKNSTAPPTCKWWSFSIIVSHIYEGSLKWLHHLKHLIRWPGLDTLSRPSWSSLPYLPRDHLQCTWSFIFST